VPLARRSAHTVWWTRRIAGSRALLITPTGARIFREKFGATLA
jgi:phage baseplate assembly protein W